MRFKLRLCTPPLPRNPKFWVFVPREKNDTDNVDRNTDWQSVTNRETEKKINKKDGNGKTERKGTKILTEIFF